MIGRTLSHYQVLEKVGEGGMGEVYLAKDTKLDREVAVKVLPTTFSKNKERLARFEREARLLASLNHPNIAAIHELEESDGVHFLALEYVPGETLAERINRGPIPIDEALPLFKQIAEGLEAAHEKGVIHRDLKPANIKVTPEGKVKVLDFGLAKAMQPEEPAVDFSQSPTLTKDTALGAILGTAAYMSPEQARGKAVDKRTDIWAFGCCLYEALTGKQAFAGRTVSDTLAAILKSDPAWETLPQGTPQKTRNVLHRCLEKDPYRRLRDIGDARFEIEQAKNSTAVDTGGGSAPALKTRPLPIVALTALLFALITGVIIWNLTNAGVTPRNVSRVAINLPAEQALAGAEEHPLAISPDGRQLVMVVESSDGPPQLYLRPLDQFEATALAGTENAKQPFFSPDSQWVGFLADGSLQKVAVRGGAPVKICDLPLGFTGASWGPDDTIVLGGTNMGLRQVSSGGGDPIEITIPNLDRGETSHEMPEVLPGGTDVLFTIQKAGEVGENSDIGVLSLENEKWRILEGTTGAVQPKILDSGHIVYVRGNDIFAMRFDARKHEPVGMSTPVVKGIHTKYDAGLQLAAFAVSRTGTFVYVPGVVEKQTQIVSVDRGGAYKPLVKEKGFYRQRPRLSPDGKRLAFMYNPEPGPSDIWIQDLRRGTRTRVTFDGPNIHPLWTPDGSRITYASSRPGSFNLYWKLADGSGEAEPLFTRELGQAPLSWSPEGRFLAYVEQNPESGADIWIFDLESEQDPAPILATPFNEKAPAFSPDGRWLAYDSDESGRYEVYVQSYPGSGRKWTISTNGGQEPVWSRDGKELFYRAGDSMMAVAIETDRELSSGVPRFLFEWRFQFPAYNYDVTPDGEQFVLVRGDRESLVQLNVVLDWSEELKRLVPTN